MHIPGAEKFVAMCFGGMTREMILSPTDLQLLKPSIDAACRSARPHAIVAALLTGGTALAVNGGVMFSRGLSQNAILDDTVFFGAASIGMCLFFGLLAGWTIVMPMVARKRLSEGEELFDCYWGTKHDWLPKRSMWFFTPLACAMLLLFTLVPLCVIERVDEHGILAGQIVKKNYPYTEVTEVSIDLEATNKGMSPFVKVVFKDGQICSLHEGSNAKVHANAIAEYVSKRSGVAVRKGRMVP